MKSGFEDLCDKLLVRVEGRMLPPTTRHYVQGRTSDGTWFELDASLMRWLADEMDRRDAREARKA